MDFTAAFVITTNVFATTSYVFNTSCVVTLTFLIFRAACNTVSSFLSKTISVFLLKLNAFKNACTNFVFVSAKLNSFKTVNSFAASFCESALLNAITLACLFTFLLKSLGFGANTIPPPFHCGPLLEPCLARPVPFCLQGFFA